MPKVSNVARQSGLHEKKNSGSPTRAPRARDAEATQKRILAAAKKEFAMSGLAGARVDIIAERAEANKRMIYHYFGSKEALFERVLEDAYADICIAEQSLKLDHLAPKEALETLVRFTWKYYLENPEFLTLVNNENLQKAVHLQASEVLPVISRNRLDMVESLLARGVKAGIFRRGIDAMQLNITIAAVGYYYITNRFTGSIIFDCDFMAPDLLRKRLEFNIETIIRTVCK
ncbi:MAG: TetR/AcrR family transcriptional regulator [Komagataeibacter saccharivorans]|uniref:TetR/AcrR family transcriptional regulator n=1 Tax=Komagataeibacter saccharivorans TaxID=265959 RepID=UPI0024A9D175|nr:TetR/AcrR family transcriptional regulator [Komagataeibacter saccharivorans]